MTLFYLLLKLYLSADLNVYFVYIVRSQEAGNVINPYKITANDIFISKHKYDSCCYDSLFMKDTIAVFSSKNSKEKASFPISSYSKFKTLCRTEGDSVEPGFIVKAYKCRVHFKDTLYWQSDYVNERNTFHSSSFLSSEHKLMPLRLIKNIELIN